MKMFVMALSLVAICGIAIAQDNPANKANPSHQKLDDHIAACLTLANQNEIALAKTAEEKSSNPEVKSFAQQIEQDHTKFMSQITKFGGNEFRNRDTSARRDGERRDDSSATPRNADQAKNAASSSQDQVHMQIKRELADECLASTQRELSQKSGQEFDDCYVGMQIAAHMQMVTELKVLQRHASPELASVLKEGQNTAQKHLDHAKQLMKTLAKAQNK
jgi:predicted outer membrane protein